MPTLAPQHWRTAWPANVWAGCTVEDQRRADERIPWLLDVPARVRFLSCEPLLERVSIVHVLGEQGYETGGPEGWRVTDPHGIGWVIVGGESGPGARPCELDWVRSLVRQCQAADVPAFVKQLGARASDPTNGVAGAALRVDTSIVTPSLRLRDRKGGDESEWPIDLRVREFPTALSC